MINKKLLILSTLFISSGLLMSCGRNPSPSPEPTPVVTPIDFDLNPSTDSNITLAKNKTKQVQIAFKDTSYASNVGSITWEIKSGSSNYISKVEEADNHTWYKFKADNITPISTSAELSVTVVAKNKSVTKTKSCYIDIWEPCKDPITLDHDGEYYTYKESGAISKGKRYKFTIKQDTSHNFYYFGMSNEAGSEPYFDIGYKDKQKTLNIFAMYKNDTDHPLSFGTQSSYDAFKYVYKNNDFIIFKNNLFSVNDVLIIECVITKDLSNGLWAYVGSHA